MTSSAKWTSWIIIALLILGGGYWYFFHKTMPVETPLPEETQAVATTPPPVAPAGSLLTAKTDTGDGALDQDTASVDAGMTGLSSDYANVDSSLSDAPVQQ